MSGLVDYSGRRVVVTGCASGIGRCLTDLLLEAGAEVVGLDRTPVRIAGVDVRSVDLASTTSVAEAAGAIDGEVHALFNVAGLSGAVPPETVVGINFWGTRELTELLVDRIPAGGAVVTTGSIAGSHYRARRELVAELSALPDRDAALAWCR